MPTDNAVSFRLPGPTERVSVIGKTGSGKTFCGLWLLSHANFHEMPWIIFDSKGDDLIADLPAKPVSIYEAPPSEPGLYVASFHPAEIDVVTAYLWVIWAAENIGTYYDEGYMIGRNNPAFNALLTQGRSKHCPMIILSQRPVFMSKFVFSESDFFFIYHLNVEDDKKTVDSYTMNGLCESVGKLPPYFSRWYDVKRNGFLTLQPVPDADNIKIRFNERSTKRIRFI